ncbi:hypothetical protein EVAR_85834_1 [Eumeta japonica]|uniref:Uncharacterized protein n=1 Tax=Eumeta variegata TaxID=151549 RepID=A0A4C1UQC3_EUMVA|nr:hypothetical protein EVAR_85834_1 [Eumeta japonica]
MWVARDVTAGHGVLYGVSTTHSRHFLSSVKIPQAPVRHCDITTEKLLRRDERKIVIRLPALEISSPGTTSASPPRLHKTH